MHEFYFCYEKGCLDNLEMNIIMIKMDEAEYDLEKIIKKNKE